MKKLFVLELIKTGTSSMVGLLNSHQNIFIMYEVNPRSTHISKYGKQLLNVLPEARVEFNNYLNFEESYNGIFKAIKRSKFSDELKYFGDKLVLNEFLGFEKEFSDSNIIFMIRDIKTWLCKKQVIESYMTDIDIVSRSINYLKFLINTFKFTNSIKIKMEDFILNH